MIKSRDKLNSILICIILTFATFIAYEPVRYNDFTTHFDDDAYIIDNSHVNSGLTIENILWACKSYHAHNWHPLTWISHMLDYELYGLNPSGHHFTNVLLHAANALLLFLVLKRMTGNLWPSGFVAAAFALHPLHVESVAWAAERKDVLSTFFWILTIWAYVRYVENLGVKRYLLMLLFFALALTAKQMPVTLPFLLLLLDYWPLGRLKLKGQQSLNCSSTTISVSIRRCFVEKIPLLILSAYASMIVYSVQHHTKVMKSEIEYPLVYRLGNVSLSYIIYIRNMLWPRNLAIFYPHPLQNLQTWQAVGAALFLFFLTAVIIWKMRRHSYLAVGWLWYLGTLVPAIGLVQVGMQAYADRYTYIPLNGLFIMIAWGLPHLLSRLHFRKEILFICSIALFSILMVLTRHQVKLWRNEQTLYKHATIAVKDNWWAYNTYGSTLKDEGKFDEAKQNYIKALNIKPDYAVGYYNLGSTFYALNELEEAIKCWSKTIQISPYDYKAYENLAVAHYQQGNIKEAIRCWTETVKLNPQNQRARNNLNAALYQLRKTKKPSNND